MWIHSNGRFWPRFCLLSVRYKRGWVKIQKKNILLTREVVEDSIFGGKENRDNWNRAFAYSDMLRKTKGEITTYSPKYLYKIFLYEKEAYKKIISFEADLNSTIITTRRVW